MDEALFTIVIFGFIMLGLGTMFMTDPTLDSKRKAKKCSAGGKHKKTNVEDKDMLEKARVFIRDKNNIDNWREFVSLEYCNKCNRYILMASHIGDYYMGDGDGPFKKTTYDVFQFDNNFKLLHSRGTRPNSFDKF